MWKFLWYLCLVQSFFWLNPWYDWYIAIHYLYLFSETSITWSCSSFFLIALLSCNYSHSYLIILFHQPGLGDLATPSQLVADDSHTPRGPTGDMPCDDHLIKNHQGKASDFISCTLVSLFILCSLQCIAEH